MCPIRGVTAPTSQQTPGREVWSGSQQPPSCKGQSLSPVTCNFILTDGPSKNISAAVKAEHLAMQAFLRALPSGTNKDGPKAK